MKQRRNAEFPSHFIPNKKKGKKWIMDYAKAIYQDFHGSPLSRYQYKQMKTNEQYAKGKQDSTKYRTRLGIRENQGHLAVDFTPAAIFPKLLDVAVGMISNLDYKPSVKAIDPLSVKAKEEYERQLRAYEAMQRFMGESQIFQEVTKGKPKSLDDIEVHMEMDYKQAIEIATEQGLSMMIDDAEWNRVKHELIYNILVYGVAGMKLTTSEKGLKWTKMNPKRIVAGSAYKGDYSDAPYRGEISYYTISQLRQMPGADSISEKEWEQIAINGNHSKRHDYSSHNYSNSYVVDNYGGFWYDETRVEVLEFEFNSHNYKVHEKVKTKYGIDIMNERDLNYTPPKKSKYDKEKVSSAYEVIYKGIWITGSNHLLDYGLSPYMARGSKTKGEYGKAYSNYIIYCPYIGDEDHEIHSLTERCITFIDQFQLEFLSYQNAIARAIPKGLAIDADSLLRAAEMLGLSNPLKLIEMYRQDGTIITVNTVIQETYTANQRPPVIELENGLGRQFMDRLATMDASYQRIRDVIGIPAGLDATANDSRQLVGTTEIAATASTHSLSPIYRTVRTIFHRSMKCAANKLMLLAEVAAMRGKPMPGYLRALGEMNEDTLALAKRLSEVDLAIGIDEVPTQEELNEIAQFIQIALDRQEITVADAMDVRRVAKDNAKKASILLKVRAKKNMQQRQEMEMQNIQANSQQQQESAAAAHQMRMQELEFERMIEMEKIQAKGAIDIELKRMELQGKAMIAQSQDITKIGLETIKGENNAKKETKS